MIRLLGAAVALALFPLDGSSQTAPRTSADTAALRFHGIRAGAHLDELNRLIRARAGGRLRCDPAKRDRRVSECRGVVSDSAIGQPVKLWISAVDSVAGIITLSAELDQAALDRWRRHIESRYGRVSSKLQGNQTMMQWVRRGRMLRLTWRTDRRGRIASVSLVDGRVLDGWGRSRTATPPRP
jgi:hypothetical protein